MGQPPRLVRRFSGSEPRCAPPEPRQYFYPPPGSIVLHPGQSIQIDLCTPCAPPGQVLSRENSAANPILDRAPRLNGSERITNALGVSETSLSRLGIAADHRRSYPQSNPETDARRFHEIALEVVLPESAEVAFQFQGDTGVGMFSLPGAIGNVGIYDRKDPNKNNWVSLEGRTEPSTVLDDNCIQVRKGEALFSEVDGTSRKYTILFRQNATQFGTASLGGAFNDKTICIRIGKPGDKDGVKYFHVPVGKHGLSFSPAVATETAPRASVPPPTGKAAALPPDRSPPAPLPLSLPDRKDVASTHIETVLNGFGFRPRVTERGPRIPLPAEFVSQAEALLGQVKKIGTEGSLFFSQGADHQIHAAKLNANTLLLATTWLWKGKKGTDFAILTKENNSWSIELMRWNPFASSIVPAVAGEYRALFDHLSEQAKRLDPGAKNNLDFRLRSVTSPSAVIPTLRSVWGEVKTCDIDSAPSQDLSRTSVADAERILSQLSTNERRVREHGKNHTMTTVKLNDSQFLLVTTWRIGEARDGDAVLFTKTASGFTFRVVKPTLGEPGRWAAVDAPGSAALVSNVSEAVSTLDPSADSNLGWRLCTMAFANETILSPMDRRREEYLFRSPRVTPRLTLDAAETTLLEAVRERASSIIGADGEPVLETGTGRVLAFQGNHEYEVLVSDPNFVVISVTILENGVVRGRGEHHFHRDEKLKNWSARYFDYGQHEPGAFQTGNLVEKPEKEFFVGFLSARLRTCTTAKLGETNARRNLYQGNVEGFVSLGENVVSKGASVNAAVRSFVERVKKAPGFQVGTIYEGETPGHKFKVKFIDERFFQIDMELFVYEMRDGKPIHLPEITDHVRMLGRLPDGALPNASWELMFLGGRARTGSLPDRLSRFDPSTDVSKPETAAMWEVIGERYNLIGNLRREGTRKPVDERSSAPLLQQPSFVNSDIPRTKESVLDGHKPQFIAIPEIAPRLTPSAKGGEFPMLPSVESCYQVLRSSRDFGWGKPIPLAERRDQTWIRRGTGVVIDENCFVLETAAARDNASYRTRMIFRRDAISAPWQLMIFRGGGRGGIPEGEPLTLYSDPVRELQSKNEREGTLWRLVHTDLSLARVQQ